MIFWGVGNALVDETFYVEKNFVDSTDLFFNQFKSISYEDQEDILSGLPSDAEPDVYVEVQLQIV